MSDTKIPTADNPSNLILIAGATGYVGGRLLHALERSGHRVRCLARQPESLRERVAETTEVVQGDVLEPASLPAAMEGVRVAYYLVHAMASTKSFEEEDRKAAESFAAAARDAKVARIVYLGGLGAGDSLSAHLRSRQEVGRIFRESGVTTIEFRTSIIVGSGSVSFEIVRALVEKLPVMTTPKWVKTRTQPIAIEDVIAYLVQALDIPADSNRVFEIGGADQVSYLDLMKEYALQRGLKRWMIPVPVLSPRLSSLWLGLVTPVYARVGRELVESLRNQTVVTDRSAEQAFVVRPLGFRAALKRALVNEDQEFAHTRWSDAFSSGGESREWGGVKFGRRIVDSRSVQVPFSPADAFHPVERLGGQTGWYYADWLWHLRGFLDLAFRGVGMRRGRRSPSRLFPGDTLDFWRVEKIAPARLLRLAAEMRLPGRAWLQFEVEPCENGSLIRQTAIFDPVGLIGQLYWYALYPIHRFVFAGMLAGIVRAMRRQGSAPNAVAVGGPKIDGPVWRTAMRVNYHTASASKSGGVVLLSHTHPEVEGAEFVVFTDPSRKYVDCTDGVCRLLGYQRSEMLARTIENVSFHDAEVSKLFAEYLRRGKMDGEFVLRHKNGNPIPIRYRAFVFADGCTAAVWEPIKDWRELYLSALVEIDPAKLKHKAEVALLAVHQRTQELNSVPATPHSEQQSLCDATSALRALLKSS